MGNVRQEAMMVKVYQAVLDQLTSAGVRHFAGMVGSTSAPYVGTLSRRNDARYLAVRHEQVAASMMDASARLSGQPGCLMVHGGSGLLAASLGIASAGMDSTPMVVLSLTQERRTMERGGWQTTDVLAPIREVTKWRQRVERPDQAVDAVRRALAEAVSGRPGVAQLDIPIDVSIDDLDGAPPEDLAIHRAPMHRPWPDPAAVRAAAELIAKAQRPVILIGGGASYAGAGQALVELAEVLIAPVVNTPTSRGVVPENHPNVLGPSGIIGYEPMSQTVAEADLVLAIGSRLSDIQLSGTRLLPPKAPLIQVDIEASAIAKAPAVDLGIVADARAFAEALRDAVGSSAPSSAPTRRAWVESRKQALEHWREVWLGSAPDNGKVQPQEIVRALSAQPPETIYVHGAGDHGFFGFMLPVQPPGDHLMSTRLGAMGCTLGSALGAKLERPEQPVIGCVGDGDFMLQLGDVETMVREELPVVMVIFNNFRLGSQRKRVEAYGDPIGVDHSNPDFAKLARLFGCEGFRVERPGEVQGALQAALDTGRPALIDVLVDPQARPPRVAISREAT